MAVGTQQHALPGLRARPVERARHALARKVEALARRIDVMELQRGDAVPVAARHTPAARLLDEDLLDEPPALGDGLDGATRAAVLRLRPDLAEPRPAVPRAVPEHFRRGVAVAPHATRRDGLHAVVA